MIMMRKRVQLEPIQGQFLLLRFIFACVLLSSSCPPFRDDIELSGSLIYNRLEIPAFKFSHGNRLNSLNAITIFLFHICAHKQRRRYKCFCCANIRDFHRRALLYFARSFGGISVRMKVPSPSDMCLGRLVCSVQSNSPRLCVFFWNERTL